jgi:isopentenyl phosphate kinase
MRVFLALSCSILCILLCLALSQAQAVALEDMDVVLIKVGGSSITDKAIKETLNIDAIDWFARILSSEVSTSFRSLSSSPLDTNESITSDNDNNKTCRSTNTAFIVIHGAGSFGHQSAKEYGLKGQMYAPQPVANRTGSGEKEELHRRHIMQGVAQTRLSVQTLNRHVVSTFVKHGMNAVSISPCFSVPSMQAHGGDETTINFLSTLVRSTLQAGLVPVLHGDACLYGESEAGILSGDTLMEMLGKADWVSRAVFLTDVDGVFTKDPRSDPNAQLLRTIEVDADTAAVVSVDLEVSGSSHEHDVTGGLKVSKNGDTPFNPMSIVARLTVSLLFYYDRPS